MGTVGSREHPADALCPLPGPSGSTKSKALGFLQASGKARMRTDPGTEGCSPTGLGLEQGQRAPDPRSRELDDVVEELHGPHDVLIL